MMKCKNCGEEIEWNWFLGKWVHVKWTAKCMRPEPEPALVPAPEPPVTEIRTHKARQPARILGGGRAETPLLTTQQSYMPQN